MRLKFDFLTFARYKILSMLFFSSVSCLFLVIYSLKFVDLEFKMGSDGRVD
jgi:hypothetical protein